MAASVIKRSINLSLLPNKASNSINCEYAHGHMCRMDGCARLHSKRDSHQIARTRTHTAINYSNLYNLAAGACARTSSIYARVCVSALARLSRVSPAMYSKPIRMRDTQSETSIDFLSEYFMVCVRVCSRVCVRACVFVHLFRATLRRLGVPRQHAINQ